MEAKTVVFDMDGVIFDSERMSYDSWVEIAHKHHLKRMESVYYLVIGVNHQMGVDILKKEYGEDFPYEQFMKEAAERNYEKYGNKIPLKKGVKELLAYLQENNYKIGLASSTNHDRVELLLKEAGLLDYFDIVIGGDMVEKSKPNPDIFLKAAKLLHSKPENMIVIEDSHNGIRAANRAGMLPIMVPDMMPITDEMKELAHVILDSLLDVIDWLKKQH